MDAKPPDQAAGLAERFGRFADLDTVVLAVSGGSDSLALLRLFWCWQQRCARRRPRVIVATVDHGLRSGSADEARFVRTVALGLGLEHCTLRWVGAKPDSGLQDAARVARYRLLCGLCERLAGRTALLTGHTRDDQAETVLMRLARGSGPDGLAGIAAAGKVFGTDVFRPLLDLSRADLRTHLQAGGHPWIDDPSNELTMFERVRVRHARAAGTELGLTDRALARTAQRMARAAAALDHFAVAALEALDTHDACLRRFGVVRWPQSFWDLPEEIAIRLARRVLHAVGGQDVQPGLGQTERVVRAMREADFRGVTLAGCRVHSIGVHNLDDIVIFRESGRNLLEVIAVAQPGTFIWDGRFRISVSQALPQGSTIAQLGARGLGWLSTTTAVALPQSVPRAALAVVPAVWCGDDVLAVPALAWTRAPTINVQATFLTCKLLHRPAAANHSSDRG